MTYDLDNFKHWDVIAICVSMAVLFGFEMVGVVSDKYATITALTKLFVPTWIRAMICGWMFYHFVILP